MSTSSRKFTRLFLAPIQPFIGILIGFYTFMWGLWVLSPFWTVFDKGPQYEVLMSLAREPVWGFIATILGVIIMKACWNKNVEVIKYTALVGFYFWGLVCTSYLYSNWQALAWIPAAMFSIIEGYAYLNLTIREKDEILGKGEELNI